MKRYIQILFVAVLVFVPFSVFAGSIPEDLLRADDAQIFFAEVVYYHPDKESADIELSPVKVVKGDVKTGVKLTYYTPNTIGDFKVKEGNVYLFTYFDENNPTDIFEVTSYDTSTLKLKNVEGDMWERFEKYLNEGRYEDAEHERLDKQNEDLPIEGENISLAELIGVPKETAEVVKILYEGRVYDIDADTFYKAIDDIVLTDIVDVSLEKKNGDTVALPYGMYITVNGFDGYAFISDDCKVDKYGMHYSRLPIGQYTIKFSDRAKITALFEVNPYELPPLESLYARYIVCGVLLSGVVIFIIAFAIAFVVKKKRDSTK